MSPRSPRPADMRTRNPESSLPEALSDIEQSMPGFARWLYGSVRQHLGDRVVDAGAGIGTYSTLLLEDGKTVASVEYVPAFAKELRRKFAGHARVSVYQADLADRGALSRLVEFDSILCLNVFEHIEDDIQAMKNLLEKVRPGGTLVALVPAYPWLFNGIDRAVGHHRRYRRAEFLQKLTAAGWSVERCFRFNAFGLPGWFFAGNVLRRNKPGRDLTRLFDACVPAFSLSEKYLIRGAVGLSIVAVCRRAPG